MRAARGHLLLLLHAHLPFVRHPEHEDFLEERWLFEAISESYLPLLGVLERLEADGVPHRITLSATAPLLNMLADPLLQSRYLRHLDRLIAFTEAEVERTRAEPPMHRLAVFYRDLYRQSRRTFADRHGGNLVAPLRRLLDSGSVEIVASAATHGFLPLLAQNEKAVRAQIRVGIDEHRRFFGRAPSGFWLPECAYYPGVDAILAEFGIRYLFVDTHGVLLAEPRPVFGHYAPILTRSGVAVFARDAESSRQVWSAATGYPGDYDYRDFYRDVGFDLPLEEVRALLPPSGERLAVGVKYHRITGPTTHKEPYDIDLARAKVEAHASNFVANRVEQIEHHARVLGIAPTITAPFDAELFGHWWFEGPQWLELVMRKLAYDQDAVALATAPEILERQPVLQEATPAYSSWGQHGYNEVWLSGENDWIYRHLHAAAERMCGLASTFRDATGLQLRALNQAARELLLAQSSDWAFIMSRGTVVEYAIRRTRSHLERFLRLADDLLAARVDPGWLAEVEARDNVFPAIDYRIYA
jgi:1,4-alpha-glucan branching enzyme